MSQRLADTDLSELFGIDLPVDADAPTEVAAILCGKCHGGGKFIGWNGKPVGPCFTCSGSGLARTACVTLKPGDCAKCVGTGQYSANRPCFTCNGTGREVVAEAIDVKAIETAFAAAFGNGIKRPKLRLDTFVFSRAPDHGVNAGSIYVKSVDGEYLGKVSSGQFKKSFACDDASNARVIAVAFNPHNAAKAYGAKTGSCSCCGRELTNGESVELGIGPICRDKFGW